MNLGEQAHFLSKLIADLGSHCPVLQYDISFAEVFWDAGRLQLKIRRGVYLNLTTALHAKLAASRPAQQREAHASGKATNVLQFMVALYFYFCQSNRNRDPWWASWQYKFWPGSSCSCCCGRRRSRSGTRRL